MYTLVKPLAAMALVWLASGVLAETPSPETNPPAADRRLTTAKAHWAFQRPDLAPLPPLKNPHWARNPIDAFVLARLEKENLAPSSEADRRTLIRRLSFDLLGLPPNSEEVREFVNDPRPDAYERLVDRLLASPHFGEQWGRHWLDLARYADSDGYEKDSIRPYAWLYRDWVINAINADLPFDQFTIEQLAGDLLPDATPAQKAATGFHRQTLTNKEGGVDQEEFRCKAVVDRVNTTVTVWLGLTLGCAECHSHKYDPITQREFYQMFAFFNQSSEKDLPAPQPDELAKYEGDKNAWDQENARLKRALVQHWEGDFIEATAKWEKALHASGIEWTVLEPRAATSMNGATLKIQSDHSITAGTPSPPTDTYTIEAETDLRNITGFRVEALDDPEAGQGPGRAPNGNFVLSEFAVKVRANNEIDPVSLTNASADFSQKDYSVELAIDGKADTGWAISPQRDKNHVATFETVQDLKLPDEAKLVFTLDQRYGQGYTLGRIRLSATTAPRPLKVDTTPDAIRAILDTLPQQRDAQQRALLARFYREEIDPGTKKLQQRIAAHAKREPKSPETKAATLAEDTPRPTHIHVRGDFLRKGDAVQPGTPSVLPPLKPRSKAGQASRLSSLDSQDGRTPSSTPNSSSASGTAQPSTPPSLQPDRLDLARWLVDPANPLCARVTVNHVWRQLFGRGLVATENDFGTRGERPSHPELLDWLAITFTSPANPSRNTNHHSPLAHHLPPGLAWSRKALIKLIVTSATYRQSSRARPELLERDPLNILLARQARLRLEAENIRDAALAVSGLLNSKSGGPSIRPALPSDIAAIGYANSIKWNESSGADKYRRGLYIFFQRTVPYPMLTTFDAPDSNTACTRRERSNTPLQALTLLNDPVFFECAQALGKRMAEAPAATPAEKLEHGFETCLRRPPTAEELDRLERLRRDYLRMLDQHPENAAKIAGLAESEPGLAERAAWVAVARTLLNLDEFVTRE
jgi:hypothetical protein